MREATYKIAFIDSWIVAGQAACNGPTRVNLELRLGFVKIKEVCITFEIAASLHVLRPNIERVKT